MKKSGIMAMEGMEEIINADEAEAGNAEPEAPVEDAIEAEAEVVRESEDATAQAEEGESIAETIEQIEDSLEQAVESGEGLSEPAAEIANAALEHFYQRLDYTGRRRAKISLEGFDKPETRLANTKAALEELRAFNPLLAKGLAISQEGMGEKFMRRLGQIVTTRDALLKNLDTVSKAYDNGEPRTGLIESPAFGATLNPTNKDKPGAAEAIAALKQSHDELFNAKRIKAVSEGIEIAGKIQAEVKDTNFVPNEKNVAVIKGLTDKLKAVLGDTIMEGAAKPKGNGKESFEPLDKSDKKKIVGLVHDLLNDKAAGDLVKKLHKEISELGVHADWFSIDLAFKSKMRQRVAGPFAADLAETRKALKVLRAAAVTVAESYSHSFKVAYDAVSYIKASTGVKKEA